MTRTGLAALLVCAAIVTSACTRTNDGVATAGSEQERAATTSGTSETPTTETAEPDPREDDPEPGVVPTTQTPAPAGTPGFEEAAALLTADFEIGLP
jgi:hypothetical protein